MIRTATPPADWDERDCEASDKGIDLGLPLCVHCGDEVIDGYDGLGSGWSHSWPEGHSLWLRSGEKTCLPSKHVTVGWTRIAARPANEWYDARPAGLWHAECDGKGLGYLSWCGSRLKGSISRNRQPGAPAPTDGRICASCLRSIKQDRPQSYRP